MTARKTTPNAQVSASDSAESVFPATLVSSGPTNAEIMDAISSLVTIVKAKDARLDAVEEAIGQLRQGMRVSSGREPEPLVTKSVQTGDAWTGPRYDDDYMLAAGCVSGHPPDREAMRSTYQAAQQRIAAERRENQPGTLEDFALADANRQRRVNAAAGPDMRDVVSFGGAMVRHPGGQTTTKLPAVSTCPSGHPVKDDATFCPECGSELRLGGIGEEDLNAEESAERRLREERQREEGVID
jgi:hypothetical protein